MKMRKRAMTTALLVMFGLTVCLIGCEVKSNTVTSLLMAGKALQERNFVAFERFVAVDRIVDQCVTLLFDEAKAKTKTKKRHERLLKFGEKFARPYLVDTTKDQFRKAVEDGRVASQIPGTDLLPSGELMFRLVGLFGVAKTDGGNYEILSVEETNTGERLKLRVKFEGEWLELHLRSRKASDHYKIVEVENLRDVAKVLLGDAIK
jgi:hypothetical protein